MSSQTYIDKNGYARFTNSGIPVHIWQAKKKFGYIPKGYIIHHIDGNKLNNNPKNLEMITRQEHYKEHVIRGENKLKKIYHLLKEIKNVIE